MREFLKPVCHFFQIFDRTVNTVKNFTPDDAQNVRKCLN